MDIEEDRVVYFPDGLLGFPGQKSYAILDHRPGSPFLWLQSMDLPDLAFVMTNPFLIRTDYLQALSPEEMEHFACKDGREITVFAIVTIPPGRVEEMTVNLLGPLVIDLKMRAGRQVILSSGGYSHRHPVHQGSDSPS